MMYCGLLTPTKKRKNKKSRTAKYSWRTYTNSQQGVFTGILYTIIWTSKQSQEISENNFLQ